jgi:hypothetical protein
MRSLILSIVFLTSLLTLVGCNDGVTVSEVDQTLNTTPQPTATVAVNEDSFECVRAEPEPVVKKNIYPKTEFRLETNKEFPFQKLGYETVEFKNGDKLLIEHVGCENYTLIFRFETKRFTAKP